jgi:hypothetical protein
MRQGDVTREDESVQAPTPFVGTFTRDMTLASGTQAVTGVGFRPTIVYFQATGNFAETSFGFDTVTSRTMLYDNHNSVANSWGRTTADSIFMETVGGGTSYGGEISTFDADGFTFSWQKVGFPTGTCNIQFLAFK